MRLYYQEGDGIKGDRIRCESRQTGHIRIINKSRRHKAQSLILKDNCLCVIEKKLKHALSWTIFSLLTHRFLILESKSDFSIKIVMFWFKISIHYCVFYFWIKLTLSCM